MSLTITPSQPLDGDLTAIAALAGTTGLLQKTAADTWSLNTTSYLPLSGGTMTGAISFAAGQTWPTFNQNTTGSAATLTTARTINGTSFNGSANITTANWGTARTITIGNTGKSVDGSGNVSWTLAEIGAGAETWSRKTANYTAVAGDKLIADTAGGAFTITLPASPTTGTTVAIVDGANWRTTNLTVARNAQTIEGLAEDLVLDIPGIEVKFIYDGTTWEVYASTGPAGVDVSNDTSSNITAYPTWVTSTSGNHTVKVTSTKLTFNPSTGDLGATNFNSLSDARKKSNIHTITNALEILQQLRGVYYTWNDTGLPSVGVIAQEVETVLPQVVVTNTLGEKSVSYGNIIGVLIEALKQQQQQIEDLKNGCVK